MNQFEQLDLKAVALILKKNLDRYYYKPLFDYIQKSPDLIKVFPGFLLNPEKLIFYCPTHASKNYAL